MSRSGILISDALVSFLWVWSGSLLRCFAYRFLGLGGHHPVALTLKGLLAALYLVLFHRLRRVTKGGAYNPLIVLCYAISGSFLGFLFVVFGRIPAQVIGSVIGAWLITSTIPGAVYAPHLNVDIQRGTLTEGLLTLIIIIIYLTLQRNDHRSSSLKTWIRSISKVVLHFLGSDITGGIMNPATAFGWAYVQGDYTTKEHVYVYWLAPMEATLLAVWTCSLFNKPKKHKEREQKVHVKSEDFGWTNAHGDHSIIKERHWRKPCRECGHAHCSLAPRSARSGYKKRTRRFYQNEAGLL